MSKDIQRFLGCLEVFEISRGFQRCLEVSIGVWKYLEESEVFGMTLH